MDTKFHSNLYRNLLNKTLEKNGLRESSFRRFNEERSNNSLGISILKSLFCADIKNSHLDFFCAFASLDKSKQTSWNQ